jgi:hypothetical protein
LFISPPRLPWVKRASRRRDAASSSPAHRAGRCSAACR